MIPLDRYVASLLSDQSRCIRSQSLVSLIAFEIGLALCVGLTLFRRIFLRLPQRNE
jgi:hypothetical protein